MPINIRENEIIKIIDSLLSCAKNSNREIKPMPIPIIVKNDNMKFIKKSLVARFIFLILS